MSELKLEQIGHPDAVSNSLTFDSDGTLATTTGFSSGGLKVKSSGAGTFSINPPSSDSDHTFTLPNETGTIVTTGSYVPGISAHSQFRLVNTLTAPSGDINVATNFEEVDDSLYSGKGSPVSLNGVNFEFDVTGLYLCHLTIQGEPFSDGASIVYVHGSSDGGNNYDEMAVAYMGSRNVSGEAQSGSAQVFVNVTNTTNFKLKLIAGSFESSSQLFGNTNRNATTMTFIRLGDAT